MTIPTQDVIRMAIESGLVPDALWETPELERFAELVAASEREACAKICDDLSKNILAAQSADSGDLANVMLRQISVCGCDECASAIRERSILDDLSKLLPFED